LKKKKVRRGMGERIATGQGKNARLPEVPVRIRRRGAKKQFFRVSKRGPGGNGLGKTYKTQNRWDTYHMQHATPIPQAKKAWWAKGKTGHLGG